MDTTETTEQIAVIGSGTMGIGIAQVAAQSGYAVTLYDIRDEIVAAALERLGGTLDRLVTRGKLDRDEVTALMQRISPSSTLEALAPASLVIEAAPERLDLKQQLFQQLDGIVAPQAILATNTSTLSVTQIAAGSSHPERVAGLHFFNPAPLMPLVEVIQGAATASPVVEALLAVARRMGKRPVLTQDSPGFIVNRVARPFHLEGLRLIEQGVADPATIDRLYREAGGFRMGPFELQDLIGIDINFAASQSLYEAFFQAPRLRPSARQRQQVESGHLGRKTGKGWY